MLSYESVCSDNAKKPCIKLEQLPLSVVKAWGVGSPSLGEKTLVGFVQHTIVAQAEQVLQ